MATGNILLGCIPKLSAVTFAAMNSKRVSAYAIPMSSYTSYITLIVVNIYHKGYEPIDWKNTLINPAKLESSDIYIIFRSFLCVSNIQPGSRCFSISGE